MGVAIQAAERTDRAVSSAAGPAMSVAWASAFAAHAPDVRGPIPGPRSLELYHRCRAHEFGGFSWIDLAPVGFESGAGITLEDVDGNRPAHEDTGLSWGDARIGNMIFRDWRCVAVIDWEAVTLAGPQLDLAHWLLMDDYNSSCVGVERLPGLGTRAETIALWEELTGRDADQLDWHEVLATFRLSVVMVRYAKLWAAAGRDDITDADGETLMSRHLRRVLDRVTGASARPVAT